ncbi:MAG: glycosyltransferase family 2 protein, partial [Bacteroidaceae bacterium]|nr:glycosyltransferase family 2 protein [Bacteroidaceae bacterium]
MLSVIVCTYNREKYLMPLFESIAANTLPFGRYELLVIDNNCTDGTADVCRRFAEKHPDVNFRALKETTQGLSAARNCGIRNAAGELVLYVDDDALVGTDYLQTYVDWFESHPRTMAAGGPIEPMYEDCT